jgi:AcrR family transcriptional regulator
MTTSARRWAKTDATQQRILDAATDVFTTRGFSEATMTDIVKHSGASIGSIYHHFGGKKELFLAIFERLSADVERRVDEASTQATNLDSAQAFEVYASAYFQALWANRRATLMTASGDVPAGFDRMRRTSMRTSFRRWMSVLDVDSSKRGQLLSRILIAIMAEASLMAAACDRAADVEPISDATIEWILRLTN